MADLKSMSDAELIGEYRLWLSRQGCMTIVYAPTVNERIFDIEQELTRRLALAAHVKPLVEVLEITFEELNRVRSLRDTRLDTDSRYYHKLDVIGDTLAAVYAALEVKP